MTHRMPVALLTALALSGCMAKGVGPTSGKVAMQTKVSKVQVMTKTFSLSQNQGLNKAAQSFKTLAGSLQSVFASALTPSKATPAQLETALRVAALRAAYKTAGVSEMGSAKLVVDDATGEVTAIESDTAKVTLAFKADGDTHTLDVAIVKSPDGTTGKLHLVVTGAWRDASEGLMLAPTPVKTTQPKATKKAPPTTPPTGFGIRAVEPELTATDVAPSASPTPAPSAAPSKKPYTFFHNEVPTAIESAALTFEITPKGDASLALKLDATLDQPAALPNSTMRVPTHAALTAQLPKVALDWDSTVTIAAGHSTFAAKGALTVEADNGKEAFTYEAKADEATKAGSWALTNTAAKVTLLVSATQKSPFSGLDTTTTLVSAEDGSKIGDVVLDPKRPRFATVTFTDGTKVDWELYPEGLLPTPGAPIAAAPIANSPIAKR
jgi:hypothetical protein